MLKELILGFITSFFVVLLATPSLIKVAKLKHLVDVPGEARKLHRRSVPTIGGIIIFAATIFAYAIWFPSENTIFFSSSYAFSAAVRTFKFIVAATILLFFTGVKDDIIGMAPVKKLISHILVGFILILMADVRITGLHGLFGIQEMPYWASIIFSLFTYIVVVNAINLIDGVDGLAAGTGFVACILFSVWFWYSDQLSMSLLCTILAGSLGAFLIFNFSPARIFMGDSGSLFIGALMFVFAVKCIETNTAKMPGIFQGVSAPVFAMAVLSYPLTDTLRVFFYRTLKGISPFSADRNHIHHRLLQKGFDHRKTTYILTSTTLIMSLLSIVLGTFGDTISFFLLFILAQLIYNLLIAREGKVKTATA